MEHGCQRWLGNVERRLQGLFMRLYRFGVVDEKGSLKRFYVAERLKSSGTNVRDWIRFFYEAEDGF